MIRRCPGFLLTLAFMLMFASSCKKSRDINQVEGGYIDKSILNGEWYYQATVVDKLFDTDVTFIGSSCGLERVKFEVTQKYLNAYRSYEQVPGTENIRPGEQTLIAQFPIQKHFDIRRKYNPVNGMQTNVIEENTVDLPWQQQKYMRVDWASNTISDPTCNDWLGKISMAKVSRTNSSDKKDVYRTRLTPEYIESTVEALTEPDPTVCEHIGAWNCTAASIKLKYSFKKVSQHSQYEPRDYPDAIPVRVGRNSEGKNCLEGDDNCRELKTLRMYSGPDGEVPCDPHKHNISECHDKEIPLGKTFGFFRTERTAFDREKGFVHSNKKYLINRWNIWKETKDNAGNLIPLRDRTPQTIVYYLNTQFPPHLRQAAFDVAEQWNNVFAHSIAALKSDCTPENVNWFIKRYDLMADVKKEGLPGVTVQNYKQVCHLAGQLSEEKQLPLFFGGDLAQIKRLYGRFLELRINDCNEENITAYARKHNLENTLKEQGVSEITSNNLEEACAVLEWASSHKGLSPSFTWQRFGDLRYSVINYTRKNELEAPLGYGPRAADPLTGEIINANVNVYGGAMENYAARGADIVDYINGNLDRTHIINGQYNFHNFASSDSTEFARLVNERVDSLTEKEYYSGTPLHLLNENMKKFQDSGVEEAYLNEDVSDWNSKNSHSGGPSVWAHILNPSETSSEENNHKSKIDFFGERSACFFRETVEPAVVELAKTLKGKSWEESYEIILSNILRATLAHEWGHNFGYRHNFEASSDALNFIPDAWEVDTGDYRMSPFSPRKKENQYSSIMDYTQRFNSDFGGLGPYDYAAFAQGYTHMMEVFDESEKAFVPGHFVDLLELFHYKDLPYLFAGGNASAYIARHIQDVKRRFETDKTAKIEVSNLPIRPDITNIYRRTYIPFDDYKREAIFTYFDGENQLEHRFAVPYKYCTDSHVNSINNKCNRFDMGASAEEIVDNAIENYYSYRPFLAFRRGKENLSPWGYALAFKQRTLDTITKGFRQVYARRYSTSRIFPVAQDELKATQKALDFMVGVLQDVEPGQYCLNDEEIYTLYVSGECNAPIQIGSEQGNLYNASFTKEYFYKPENVGYFYDKLMVMNALADQSFVFSKDFDKNFDRSSFAIGYYRLFSSELTQLFSALMRSDFQGFSPRVDKVDHQVVLKYQPFLKGNENVVEQALPRIEPSYSWLLQYAALKLGMYKLSSSMDAQLDFSKRARISRVGGAHNPTVAANIDQIVFTDPNTYVQYKAIAPQGEELAPGYQLLKEVKLFVGDEQRPGPWLLAKRRLEQARNALNMNNAPPNAQGELETSSKEFRQKNQKLHEKMKFIRLLVKMSENLNG